MDNETTAPAVWVGCLGCYVNGNLRGEWFPMADLDPGAGVVSAELGCPEEGFHEEVFVADYEGFAGLEVGESLGVAFAHYETLQELDETRLDVPLEVAVEWLQDGVISSADDLADRQILVGKSLEDIAQEEAEEMGGIPEHLWSFIDWEHYAKEMYNYDYSQAYHDGQIYLISNY